MSSWNRTVIWLGIAWVVAIFVSGLLMRRNIFERGVLDLYQLNTSRGYVENPLLGRMSYNKATFYFRRYLNNFFSGTDPNYFFFGGHPREVPGGNNDQKISYWLLPLFLVGVYEQLLNREYRIILLYALTLLLVSWFSVDSLWWLLAPFWYLTILYPIRDLWKK